MLKDYTEGNLLQKQTIFSISNILMYHQYLDEEVN